MANNVFIGSNVASDRMPGPVTIDTGKTIIEAKNQVTIYNDFEVKPGASLEITIQ
jgi:hypothetical protein